MIIAEGGLIGEFLDAIQQRLTDAYNAILGPIFGVVVVVEWTVILIVFAALLFVIGYFLPFKWVRATLGGLLLLGTVFYAGGITMYRALKRTPAPQKPKPPSNQPPPWKLPWEQ